MRLRVYGIPKLALILFGLLPGVAAFFFHHETFIYRRVDAIGLAVGSGVLAFFFLFFFLSGVFRIRYLILNLLYGQIIIELFASVADRNFVNLGVGILMFSVSASISLWLERKVASSHLNPKAKWFEGDPFTDSKVATRVKFADQWYEARIRSIDEKGFFVFVEKGHSFKSLQTVSFELGFKDAKVTGDARITASFKGEKSGFGLQFSPKDLYHFSQYTALVQRLRGEGLFS